MFGWLRGFGRIGMGDGVQITSGPYAGQNGVVLELRPDQRMLVYIDECCQPAVRSSELRRVRGRNIGRAAAEAKRQDVDGEIVRTAMDGRDMGNGF